MQAQLRLSSDLHESCLDAHEEQHIGHVHFLATMLSEASRVRAVVRLC